MNAFPKEKYDFRILWTTKKVRLLFPLNKKNQVLHVKSLTEFVLVKKIRLMKPNETLSLLAGMSMRTETKIQNQEKHLCQHPDHAFQQKVLLSAPMNIHKRKNLKAFFIAVKHPTLNKKKCFKETDIVYKWRDMIQIYFVRNFSDFAFFGEVVFHTLQLHG